MCVGLSDLQSGEHIAYQVRQLLGNELTLQALYSTREFAFWSPENGMGSRFNGALR